MSHPFLNLKRALELAASIEAAQQAQPDGAGTRIEIQEGDWDLVVAGLRAVGNALQGSETRKIDFSSFDYARMEDMVRLGKALGGACHDDIALLTKAISMECRVVFFAAWLGVALGHMRAAIGPEATKAIIDSLKLITKSIERGERMN